MQKVVQKEQGSTTYFLTSNDKQQLKPLILQFKKQEIYDISILRKLLKQVEAIENEQIKNWKDEMGKAIGSGNEKKYGELIKGVLEN